jgi:hypothetical protein
MENVDLFGGGSGRSFVFPFVQLIGGWLAVILLGPLGVLFGVDSVGCFHASSIGPLT